MPLASVLENIEQLHVAEVAGRTRQRQVLRVEPAHWPIVAHQLGSRRGDLTAAPAFAARARFMRSCIVSPAESRKAHRWGIQRRRALCPRISRRPRSDVTNRFTRVKYSACSRSWE